MLVRVSHGSQHRYLNHQCLNLDNWTKIIKFEKLGDQKFYFELGRPKLYFSLTFIMQKILNRHF